MALETPSQPTLGVPQRPLRRVSDGNLLGGVAGGLAVRFGVRARTVRLLFCATSLAFGLGLFVYLVLWLNTARSGEEEAIARRIGRRHDNQILALEALVVLAFIAVAHALDWPLGSTWLWSAAVSSVLAIVIWRGASELEQQQLQTILAGTPVVGVTSMRGWRALVFRVVPGVALVAIGLTALSHVGGAWSVAVPALIGAIVVVAGIAVLLTPWWLQNVRDLALERRDRVRAEERATMAAHLHDSVLQTLTLIERHAGDPTEVRRLARAEERHLREWLFGPARSNSDDDALRVALDEVQRDVERDYGVRVELITVGDCPLDDPATALVGATREAVVNAAKWSGAESVAVYAEVEPHQVTVYVRDTGRGFDPTRVGDDRHGIANSMRARLVPFDGHVDVRSSPGAGCEVSLTLPRALKPA